jgi:hypothetical protein
MKALAPEPPVRHSGGIRKRPEQRLFRPLEFNALFLAYFIVGMMNSAPDRMPVGQREVTVFSLV